MILVISMNAETLSENKKIFNDRKILSPATGSCLLRVFRSSVLPESGIYSEHHHTAFEITMVLDGSGSYSTHNDNFTFTKGDIFHFSTDEYHWLTSLDCEASFLNVHFEPRFIWSDNFGIANTELMKIFFNKRSGAANKLDNTNIHTQTIRNLLFSIEKEFADALPEYETMVKIHLISALVEMLREYDGKLSSNDIAGNSRALRYIDKAINYIDENLESDLTLDLLSDIAHMSKTYFSSSFRKLNGISPWEYITIKRIERAIHYIETTNLTKLEIALKCGFNNTSNFYHSFKRVTGKAPTDYKKHS